MNARFYLPNDDHTDIAIVRPSSYGFAQADYERKSRRKKHPLGFTQLETKRKAPAKRKSSS
jgi:hypothetical protein